MTLPPVADLVPHAAPMVLLDELVEVQSNQIVARSIVRADAPFVEAAGLPALVTLEYMAQAVAAYAGLQARADGEAVRLGFLLGCRDLRIHCDFVPIGATLVVTSQRTWGDSQLGSFACTVACDGVIVAEAVLNVAQPHNLSEVL
jgi:predicted hotdog family 3-hydroxylacyl-ACP dehydratase